MSRFLSSDQLRFFKAVEILAPAELLVVDSTPLEDWRDPEAEWGYYSRCPFKGFKPHVFVDGIGLPVLR